MSAEELTAEERAAILSREYQKHLPARDKLLRLYDAARARADEAEAENRTLRAENTRLVMEHVL